MNNSTDYAISLSKLSKVYNNIAAVDNLTLNIKKGELFALLGVNGAGKTTTIKLMSCLIPQTSGYAYMCGMSTTECKLEIKSRLNVSPQETAVAPLLSVKENLELICGIYGYDKDSTREKVEKMVEMLALDEILYKKARILSGGWQRRLSIAMALITQPEILFLDEPTLGLDVIARRDLWKIITALKGKITIILTTHYLEEAEKISDRVAIMSKGKLKAVGTARQLTAIANQEDFENAFIELSESFEVDYLSACNSISEDATSILTQNTNNINQEKSNEDISNNQKKNKVNSNNNEENDSANIKTKSVSINKNIQNKSHYLRKTMAFALRTTKEIVRDKLNLAFGLGFPTLIILLLSLIQRNIPAPLFEINNLTPGIVIFGYSFITLFSGMLIAKDRGSSLMLRLFTSPLKASNFILGYTIPLLPVAIIQSLITYVIAFLLGLDTGSHFILSIALSIPASLFFIALGLLCGSLLNEKQVGGICGALVTNISAWLSGTWIPLDAVGEGFRKVAYALPFARAVDVGRNALAGNFSAIFPDLWVVIAYAVGMTIVAVIVFTRKINGDK